MRYIQPTHLRLSRHFNRGESAAARGLARLGLFSIVVGVAACASATAADVKTTEVYLRLKKSIDAVRAIDTHDHLYPFSELPNRHPAETPRSVTLYSLWRSSYLPRTHRLSPWEANQSFDRWWETAQHDFSNARATSFYRVMLPAFRDLYGVDFDKITPEQARDLNAKIEGNYKNEQWADDVITKRANIELVLVDPFWAATTLRHAYRFTVPVMRVSTWISGSHPNRFKNDLDSPYSLAKREGLPMTTFDEYLAALDASVGRAMKAGAVSFKTTTAYERDLRFDKVSPERAAAGFGKPPEQISAQEQEDFENFMFWRMCELSAQHDMPFQIHTGNARVQGSNPLLLLNVIEANPKTKFVLFHGGYPWIGETGAIAMRHSNVWIDSNWLPTISYSLAKRAYQEWLEVVSSDRILWGADTIYPEAIYGATETTRQCLAEALAEKVERGELLETDAARIGRQILRENALKLFPRLQTRLWRID